MPSHVVGPCVDVSATTSLATAVVQRGSACTGQVSTVFARATASPFSFPCSINTLPRARIFASPLGDLSLFELVRHDTTFVLSSGFQVHPHLPLV